MKTDERYVFDTNVLVSALLFESSKPGQAFLAALERGRILISLSVLKELNEVLSRKKFDRYLLREERDRFLEALVREAVLVEISEQIQICRDPKDDKFLELAVSGEATCLISGDDDLLQLGRFREIPILSPDQFLSWL
jgi:putative PIN family toxin of toxin-antitoxin system